MTQLPKTTPRPWPLRPWTVGLVLWTLVLAGVLRWIWCLPPGSLHGVDAAQSGVFSREWWYLFHANFHALYPILLFLPYLWFISTRMAFGLARWWWSVPSHLLCAVALLWTSPQIVHRIADALPTLLYVKSSGGKVGKVTTQGNSFTVPVDVASSKSSKVEINFEHEALKPARAAAPSAAKRKTRWLGAQKEDWIVPGVGFLILSGVAHATAYHRRVRLRETQAAALESQLTRSRLAALQSQLQPHFLFNTLNGIVTLIRHQPAVAEDMITSLSGLLRTALDSSRRPLIPLAEEIAFIERYLALQRMRFGDRLQVAWEISQEANALLVPVLLLQPLVENAIIHGIEPSSRPGRLEIAARIEGAQLVLTVTDDGLGFEPGAPPRGTGHGTTNTRELLNTFYPGAHSFDIATQPGSGTRVVIRIPITAASA